MTEIKNILLAATVFIALLCSCSSSDEPCVKKRWYIDVDGDGFGSAQNFMMSCEQPEGYVENDEDCDDDNRLANPDGQEVQNNIDDNCDGIIDECDSNDDCDGVCIDGICVDLSTDFAYEFTKYDFNHDLTSKEIPYSFFEPQQVLGTTDEKFPLIIALHGIEYFANNEDVFLTDETTGYFVLAWIKKKNQQRYPAYVVAPNLFLEHWLNDYPNSNNLNSVDLIEKLLEYLLENNQTIDSNRVT